MDKQELRIVFMGTPEFAVASLKAILENEYQVVGVITAPDKESGRGKKIRYSAVKEFALEKNLPLLQPEKLKSEDFLKKLRNLHANLQVVVAFRMLPEVVWNMPKLGTFNLHASLLPQYRGAAPINHAIINGEKETGLTTFFLDKEIDTGRIIAQQRIAIDEKDNFGTLHDRMMERGSRLVVDTIEIIRKEEARAVDQSVLYKDGDTLRKAPKIFKEFCHIDWHQKSEKIYDFIRGLSPYPVAYTWMENAEHEEIMSKIYHASYEIKTHALEPGVVLTDMKSQIKVATLDGFIDILEIQIPGKKRLPVENFLNGYQKEVVRFS